MLSYILICRKYFLISLFSFLLLPTCVFAIPSIYYFPANFDGTTQTPQEVSSQANFAPICTGGTGGPRLAGLDLTRRYAGASVCLTTTATGQLVQEVEFIFLVDDTTALSPYLVTQFQAKNILQESNGRQVVRPSVLDFASSGGREGFKILVVGETAFRQALYTPQTWLTHLNSRFAASAVVVATSSGTNDIAFMFHGSYFNSTFGEIINPPLEKIMEFLQKQFGGGGVATSSAARSSAASVATATNGYIDQCRANSVPIPPVWNPTTGTNQWQRRGTLSSPFAAPGLANVEVWTFNSTSPQGICIALPRMDGPDINTNVQALGIICQSETTGKACFWDNVERPSPDVSSGQSVSTRRNRPVVKITGASTRNLSPTRMADGYNLQENCTMCHRGSNVFITRTGTPLDVSTSAFGNLDTEPAARYQPLSGTPADTTWVNPVSTIHTRINGLSSDKCMMCHDANNEIAQPTAAYCGTILENILGTNMPQGDESNWRTYTPDVTELVRECCRLGHNLKGLSSGACPP